MAGEDGTGASPGADRGTADPGGIGDPVRASAAPDPTPALAPLAAGSVRSADADAGPMLGVHCPFLASIDVEDRVRRAAPVPDTANRCLSSGEPVAPSARDQVVLCLSGEHRACPRYVLATARPSDAAPPAARRPRLSAPIVAAVGVLALAAVLAGLSLAANGDLSIGLGTSAAAPAAASPVAGDGPGASLAVAPAGSGAPSAPAVAPASAPTAPTPAPSLAGPIQAPMGSATPRPSATPKRYPGLTPCPGKDDCYIYVVKRGDMLAAVAARYGLTLDEVLARNPKIRDPGLIVLGQKIRMPTPRK